MAKKESFNVNVPPKLKADFESARKKEDVYSSASEFITFAMAAYITQKRRGETLAFPPEFVSDKSSDKADK